jgi:hypothetical protein
VGGAAAAGLGDGAGAPMRIGLPASWTRAVQAPDPAQSDSSAATTGWVRGVACPLTPGTIGDTSVVGAAEALAASADLPTARELSWAADPAGVSLDASLRAFDAEGNPIGPRRIEMPPAPRHSGRPAANAAVGTRNAGAPLIYLGLVPMTLGVLAAGGWGWWRVRRRADALPSLRVVGDVPFPARQRRVVLPVHIQESARLRRAA